MKFDFQGNAETSGAYMNKPSVTEVVTVADSTYIRYTSEAICHIQRITSPTGQPTVFEHAYGAWANKETLTYVPANEPVEV